MSAMKKKPITVDDLWRIERLGTPSLSPDGAQCVCAVTRHAMDDNKASAQLWLLSTLGGAPRALTTCGDKDGQPRWSPRGDRIAFVARREQQGEKDEAPQLYLIAPDGGEATRAATVATGVEAFKWFPDGRRIAFVSWVWPDAKGAKANAKRQQQFKERKESAYVTGEAWYRWWDRNLPMDRVAHLLVLDVDSGKVRDLFEGTDLELTRADPDADAFDISPDGRRIAFAHDPEPRKLPVNRYALAEVDVVSRRTTLLVRDDEWSFGAPCYAPDGQRVACVASRQGFKHTAPEQLALVELGGGWQLLSGEWDHEVQAPLRWHGDAALRFAAEQHGRRHLWRFALDTRQAEVEVAGGWVLGFDSATDTVVSCADAADHPARLHAQRDGTAARRIESFNDALLDRIALGRHEERWFTGAQGDRVQMWLTYPPGFDAKGKRKHALLHVIHGGPHTAAGDNWHYRWNNAVFAAQGYVVACVNYHGSSSFGFAFKDSITHRWGPLEQQDIEAATDMLLKERWADRRRVFATGGSYGGYMVAWLNGHVAPGRYAAYVCHAGCFDWVAMVADDAYGWHAKELGAAFWDDMAKVHAQSPHATAGAMRTPTLVIHGALDYRVPDAQGLAYYNTLQSLGVDARLVWFPDENHWVLKPRNSKLWYAEFFDWLKRHDAGATAKQRRRGVS
jgi:dipeptidyl aminopeptidase/acylaminoacyl peptidase